MLAFGASVRVGNNGGHRWQGKSKGCPHALAFGARVGAGDDWRMFTKEVGIKVLSEHEDGLLEYLEDIIGTSQYKGPIDEALVKMERLTVCDRGSHGKIESLATC
jgi:hypothetical protein